MRVSLFFLCIVLFIVPGSRAAKTENTKTCIFILTQIDGATQQWALEKNKTAKDKPTWKEIGPYLPKSVTVDTNGIPVCPEGGKYSLGRSADDKPTCSKGGRDHSLPED